MTRPRCLSWAAAVAVLAQLATQLVAQDVVLDSQKDVDRFGKLGISEVNGSLSISRVHDLRPLAHVRKVSGALSISETRLRSLSGLENLTSIGGSEASDGFRYSLKITDNKRLTSLAGLRNLRGALSCGLYIRANNLLQGLEGLEGITSIKSAVGSPRGPCPVVIEKNQKLTSLNGLRGLSGDLPSNLVIVDNPSLTSLEGLENITGVGSAGGQHYDCGLSLEGTAVSSLRGLSGLRGHLRGLWVWSNPKLKTLEGLEGLKSLGACSDGAGLLLRENGKLQSIAALRNVSGPLGGDLDIQSCNSLQTLEGLEGLTAITGSLLLRSLRSLQSLSALRSVRGHLGGVVDITRCPALENLVGLEGITSVAGKGDVSILLEGNTKLQSIEGLRGLSGALPGSLAIVDCDALHSLKGLESLTSVGRFATSLAEKPAIECSSFSLLLPPASQRWPAPCSCIDIRGLPALSSIAGLGQLRGNISGSLIVVGYDSTAVETPNNITGFVGTCDRDGLGIAPLI